MGRLSSCSLLAACRFESVDGFGVTLVAFYVKSSAIHASTLLSEDPYFDFGLFHYLPLKNYLFDIFLFILILFLFLFLKHILVKSIISNDIIFLIF